jgi:hypothetical protein
MQDETTYGFSKTDAADLVQLVGSREGTYVEGMVRSRRSGSDVRVIQSPGGGIPARSGTTVGSATCAVHKIVGSTITDNTSTIVVKNIDLVAIPAGMYLLAVKESITGFYIAQHPGIINLRLSGNNLQYTFDGTTWTTWHTGTTCP